MKEAKNLIKQIQAGNERGNEGAKLRIDLFYIVPAARRAQRSSTSVSSCQQHDEFSIQTSSFEHKMIIFYTKFISFILQDTTILYHYTKQEYHQ